MLALIAAMAAAAPRTPHAPASAPLAPVPSLTILHTDPSLNATAAIIGRVVSRKSGCEIHPAGQQFTLTLTLDTTLGQEAYAASFDGQHTATIRGGDPMGVTFGAGAFLRAARFSPQGLTPPQRPPPPPPPPPPPAPLVPITDKWWAGETNHSYDYGANGCGANVGGCVR